MANTPVNKRYYPRLSSVVSTEDLPEFLGFLENDIINLLDKVYFKDLQFNKSSKGDAAHYSLSIVSPNRLDIEFFGTEVFFVLNPETGNGADFNISSFPITLEYQWKILGYLRGFDLSSFGYTPVEFYEFALRVLNLSEEQALALYVNNFVVLVSPNNTKLEQFVVDINAQEGISITTPTSTTRLSEIIEEIYNATDEYVSIIAFRKYLLTNDVDETKSRIGKFFNLLVPDGLETYIKDVLIPWAKATLTLSAGVEFPRTIFQPVYDENGENPFDDQDSGDPFTVIPADTGGFPKVLFTLAEATFSIDTKEGLDYETDLALNSTVKAQIGNTGFNIEITNAKLDLWENKNIEEAILDGRPDTFKGLYIESLEIGLPPSLSPVPGQVSSIEGTNLLIGSEGGFSGALALNGASLRATIASLVIEFINFGIDFHQNTVTGFNISADLYIPGVKASMLGTNSLGIPYGIGDDGPIALDISYVAPDYTIAVTSDPVLDIFGIDLAIDELSFGFDSDSLNNFVFKGEIFIPNLIVEAADHGNINACGTILSTGAMAPICFETSYTGGAINTFALTATDIPAIKFLGFELDIASAGFNTVDGLLSGFNMTADLLIPGVKSDDPGYDPNERAPIGLTVGYDGSNYSIAATTFPAMKIFGIELTIDLLAFNFNKTQINSSDFRGELLLPNTTVESVPAVNPNACGTMLAIEDQAVICFDSSYIKDLQDNEIFTFTASSIPKINLFGLGIRIDTFGFNILNGNLDSFGLNSVLTIPGVKASEGGIDSLGNSYSAGELAPIGLTVLYIEPNFSVTGANLPDIEFFKMSLFIHTLTFGFNDSGLNSFIFKGEIKIPNLVVPETTDLPADSALGTPLVHGEPAPIGFETEFTGGPTNIFSFTVNDIPELTLFGLGITFNSLGFELDDGDLSGFAFDADIDIPGFTGGPIGIGFGYSGITEVYTIELESNIMLEYGSFSFTFTDFDITFTKDAVIDTTIGGTVVMDEDILIFELEFTPTGWEIYVEDPNGLDFSIPGFVEGAIYGLRLGKRNDKFFVEIGKEGNFSQNKLGASLENLLNIPLIGKYLPSELEIGFLSFEESSGLDLTNAELRLQWPELEGLEITSTETGLEAVIPINKTIFKTITINTLTVSMSNIDNNGEDETKLKAVMDGTLEIGPILGTVSGIGLEATISYPETGGNLGAANIDDFGLAGPDGIGLSIDTAGIKGSGYLSFDKDKGEYAGYLGLTIQDKISLNAIAILNTKFPDGSTGISLLIILTVEFNPGIQLGFGFNLSGLGGLFGLHRTMEIEPLRSGVKDGTIDHILFPDPATFVQNASTHLSNIKAIFPVDHGRFVFGPMAKIGWGAPTLITAEIGLLLEVPKPIRLALLGVIKAILPDEDNDLIRLQINFLGLIDFGKKFISFDATIFDSKILTFTISGDMAFRLHYGDNPSFLLSVGGFHPKFNSPIPVPAMNRLMVKIADKENIRVILSTYFAVTSNTVQFGAKIDLEATSGKIVALGYFGLDVLFQFSPFYMIASISAGVAVSYDGFDLFAIHLSGELEGPTPWKVNGTATFSIIGIEKSFNMSEVFGEEKTVTYESVDVHALIVEAIDDEVNWQVTTSKLQDNNVVLKAQNDAVNIISASGTLSITQRVVPLNYTIQKYGNRVPSGARTFAIASVAFGVGATEMADLENIKEDFASAEYKNIDKSTKLSIPSFEKMDGGVKVNPPSGGLDYGGDSASAVSSQRDAEYEQTLIDFVPVGGNPSILEVKYTKSMYSLQDTWMKREVRGGAAAKSSASRTRSKLYGKGDQRVSLEEETFAVVSTDDLSITHSAKTRLEAQELMEAAMIADPTLEGQLQIIMNHRVTI